MLVLEICISDLEKMRLRIGKYGPLLLESNGLVLLLDMVIGIQQRVMPQWLYIVLPTLLGILLATLLWQPRQMWYAYFLVVMTALTLWSVYALATNFTLIPFYDSYGEFIFSSILKENGQFTLNMPWPPTYPSPQLPSSYPLFSILTVTLTLINGVDLLHMALFMPFINSLATLLLIALFAKLFSDSKTSKFTILFLALLFFAISPDAIYDAMHFYHRGYSLFLCFMVLYFLGRTFCTKHTNIKFSCLLVFLALILPLSHSYYPLVYIIFLLCFTVFIYVARLFIKPKQAHTWPPLLIFLMAFASGFLWDLKTVSPGPLTSAFRNYVHRIANAAFQVIEVEKYEQKAIGIIPGSLMPKPFIYLLSVRDILVWASALIFIVILLYQFATNRNRDVKVLFLLCATASFAPLAITQFFVGIYETLGWRYYMMPLIMFFAAAFYANILEHRRFVSKVSISILVVLLVSTAFLGLYSHIYFPRQLYDPSIGFREIGQPSSAYINLRSFVEEHPIENGQLYSDYSYLLYVIMQPKDYDKIISSKPNIYFIEFIDFKIPLGYSSNEAIEEMAKLGSEIRVNYNKLLDSGLYSIYQEER